VTTLLLHQTNHQIIGCYVQYSLRIMKTRYHKALHKKANLTVQAFIHSNPSQLLASSPPPSPMLHHTSPQSSTTITIFWALGLLKFKNRYLPVLSMSQNISIISNIQIFLNGTSCRMVNNYWILKGRSVTAYQSTRRNTPLDWNIL
jgi:hypothetical protein